MGEREREARVLAMGVVDEQAVDADVGDVHDLDPAVLDDGRLDDLGRLLTASHASMRDDFRITVPEVDTAQSALLSAGALGARMTGGGFGGCVIGLLPERSVEAAEDAVRRAFADAGFGAPTVFTAEAAAGAHALSGT